VQTTLLGLAIALILALVAALVGPLFVDWNRYRPQFEAEASRLIGVPVRVDGAIDVRILPSPTLILSGIEIGTPGTANAVKARALGVEFALGPLMRGQLRAVQTRIVGPEVTIGLDQDSRAIFPRLAGAFGLDTLAIDRLSIDEARITLTDAASGARATLDRFWFHGEVRSLAGAFKGEGAFVLNSGLYAYRLATSKLDSGGIKAKFGLDPADRPLNIDGEGTIVFDNSTPRFDGAVNVVRAPGVVLAGGQAVANEPVRVSARVKANAASALLEDIEFQYGPDERAVKLAGNGEVKFGASPRFDGTLSARQLDLDKLAASGDMPLKSPLSILSSLKSSFASSLRPAWPAKIEIGIDGVTLGGASLQSLRADLNADASDWSLDRVEFRAPGQTQVRMAGRIDAGASFTGPVDITSADPRALLAWLDGRSDLPIAAIRPLRLRGAATLGGDAVVIEKLRAEIDRRSFEGKAGYWRASGGRKARVEAELRASELDADALIDFARTMLADKKFDRPGEVSLALDLGRATIAGVEAKDARAKLKWDGTGLQVERLSVADFGGIGLSGNGQIDTGGAAPRGNLALAVDARDWVGINALAAKFMPQSIDDMRRITARIGVAKLQANLDVGKDTAPNVPTVARLTIDGNAGALRVNLRAQGEGDVAELGSARIRVDTNLNADDGGALLRALGLDGLLPGQTGAGELKLQVYGPADGDLNTSARLTVGDLTAESHGTGRFSLVDGVTLAAGLMVTKGDGRTLPLPFTMQSRLAVAGGTATLGEISASVSKTRIRGDLAVKFGRPLDISGKVETEAVDAPSVAGFVIGMPAPRADGAWPADPFLKTNLPDATGRVEFKARQAMLSPAFPVKDLTGVLRLSASEIAFENLDGQAADGRLSGAASFRRSGDGVNAQGRLLLKGADASAVIAGGETTPIAGRMNAQIELEGYGLTPRALIGSLNGSGTLSLQKAEISKLDPRVFAVAMRAVDQGAPLDAVKLRDIVAPALDGGRLALKDAEGAIGIVNGQARLGTVIAHADGADLSMSGNLDLVTQALDARLVLTATNAATSAGRPELTVTLKGPLAAPRRSLDVSALAGWLALRAVEQQSKRLEQIEAERSGRAGVSLPSTSAIAPPAGAAPRAAPLPPPVDIKPAPKPAPAPRAGGLSERDRFFDQFNSQR